MIAVVLRMADCQSRSSQTELAIKSYRLAEKLAAQTGQSKLESVADVNDALLEGRTGHVAEALQLYQRRCISMTRLATTVPAPTIGLLTASF